MTTSFCKQLEDAITLMVPQQIKVTDRGSLSPVLKQFCAFPRSRSLEQATLTVVWTWDAKKTSFPTESLFNKLRDRNSLATLFCCEFSFP